jgi:hypothetical protein
VWGPGGREIFYVSPYGKLMSVNLSFRLDSVERSTALELFQLQALDVGFSPYDTSDGKSSLVRATTGHDSQPRTAIFNWRALLKKGSGSRGHRKSQSAQNAFWEDGPLEYR